MSSTDLAITDEPKRKDGITSRVRHAVELMIWDAKPFDEAASAVGLSTRAMRLALKKPAVVALFKAEQQVLLESMGPANIHRLAAIRDKAENMPAVNSAVHLDRMRAETNIHGRSSTSQQSAGVVIHIHAAPQAGTHPQPVRSDGAKPLITLDCDSLHENVTPDE